jgi:hypothetical protein
LRRLEKAKHSVQEFEAGEEGEIISPMERRDPLNGISDPGIVSLPVRVLGRDLGNDQELAVLF